MNERQAPLSGIVGVSAMHYMQLDKKTPQRAAKQLAQEDNTLHEETPTLVPPFIGRDFLSDHFSHD